MGDEENVGWMDWVTGYPWTVMTTRATAVLKNGRTMNISDEKLTEQLREQYAHSDLRVDISDL